MAADVHPPISAVRVAVRRALAEDLTPLGDITSALLPEGVTATAELVAREDGVLAGRSCADETLRQVDTRLTADWFADDGDPVLAAKAFGHIAGPVAALLTAERTLLNFLTHLSGIATLTRRFVDAAAGRAQVWDTRKTTPGLRALEKAAVRAGGGANHRGNLSDWVLLKDNHLTVLGIEEAVRRARSRWPGRTVHVECERLDQVRAAVAAGADALLFDNMTPDELRACVQSARAAGRPILLEASGGVTLATVGDIAATGVDLVSSSAITASAPNLDIGLDVIVERA
jgi:nicotinate-nucleotide pyrophosphorylase (carboxylating)